VLFAYDAIAYYMWQMSELQKEATDNVLLGKDITKGKTLGERARNTICEYGKCLDCLPGAN